MTAAVRTALLLLLALSALRLNAEQAVVTENIQVCDALQITGTFSNLAFDDARDGLYGVEVRIVVTEASYQASLQFAEGQPSDLSIGDVEFDKHLNYWPLGVPLPESEPDTDLIEIVVDEGPRAGIFRGKVQRTRLIGTYEFASGRTLSLDLPRKNGYWD
jgi:hypothetical protein